MIKLPKHREWLGIIGVCGGAIISPKNYQIAVELGKELALKNYIVACGGLGGTMEAVCKGVRAAGGLSIGILPGSNKSRANKFVDIIIPTGLGEARNMVLVSTADGVITVDGGSGTLSEIAFAWRGKKPIISLNTTGGWSEKLAGLKIDDTRADRILSAETPRQAVALIMDKLSEM